MDDTAQKPHKVSSLAVLIQQQNTRAKDIFGLVNYLLKYKVLPKGSAVALYKALSEYWKNNEHP